MQKGYIYQANGAWHVRYRVDGEQVSRKLADYNDQYRTKRSVRPLADEVLDPLNQGREVNGPMTLQRYISLTCNFENIRQRHQVLLVHKVVAIHLAIFTPSIVGSQRLHSECGELCQLRAI
jgi:hypothetical protein